MTDKEIRELKIELVEKTDLISYFLKINLPMSPNVLLYLVEEVRILRKKLADAEALLMRELYNKMRCN